MIRWRVNLILGIIFLLAIIIIGRLFFLQIVKYDFYKALAQGQQKIFSRLPPERGGIFFSNGEKLAAGREWLLSYLSPLEVKNKEETSQLLSQVLGLKESEIKEKLEKNTFFEPLKEKLTREEAEDLQGLNLAGVYLKEEKSRYFPKGNLASHVVGFVDKENQGQYGLEGFYQQFLKGEEGTAEEERGPNGSLVSFRQQTMPEKGSDLILVLDYQIQFKAEKLLSEAKEILEFREGTIIVLDPRSGKILALANTPDFNPNEYSKEKNLSIFRNPAIQKVFEPGSVFKPITMAAALEEQKITPQTTYTDEGFVKIGNTPIYNYDRRIWGKRTMTEVLEKSINTGAIFAEQQLGKELFLKYLEKFSLFEPTGIDLQGEVCSENKDFKKGYEINFATASFGQGIMITPMQLVRAFSAIANDGRVIKPYLAEKIIDSQGKIIEIKPELSQRIISPKTASQLTAMMVNVVEKGFGQQAKVPGYYIAGKTGTAQVSWPSLGIQKSGYSEETIQSFIGFGPAFNPRFLILIKLDNPKTKSAESSAAPIFHNLAKYIIDLQQIPPDHE